MKIFVESIDTGIWDAIINGPFIPKHESDKVFVEKKNLGLNGLRLRERKLSMIALLRTL